MSNGYDSQQPSGTGQWRASRARRKLRRRESNYQARSRRGVILLLIISLLSLFSMIAITYVISAGSHKKASYALNKGGGYYGTDPKEIADIALYYTLVGTTNPRSPFVFHDILGDMYGHFGIGGKIQTMQEKANGEFLELRVEPTARMPFGRASLDEMGYLAGTVITLLNGDGIGLSTHIIWQDLNDPTLIRVKPWIADEPRRVNPAAGDRVWINGQPFAGLGFGYNKTTHRLDGEGESGKLRESLNFGETLGKNVSSFQEWVDKADNGLLFGGANEEYDAADLDNVYLCYVPGSPTQKVIPSYHRPALIRESTASKKTMLRPMKEENPNFTGSNPQFDPAEGPWDVDNDRDGRPDSVWLDPGWPAQVAANGQTYKHLVAVQVRALDGGIDINAAGNMSHAAAGGTQMPKGGYGLATGAAELDPTPLSETPGWFRKVLGQPSGGSKVNPNEIGRYGADGQPGTKQDQDRLRKSRQLNFPENWEWRPVNPMARDFGSPPPLLRSTYPLDIDPKTGQVDWLKPPPSAADGATVSPYELDLSRNAPRGPLPAARDAPFTYAEYERCIRRNDGDVTGLPSRLWNLLPETLRDYPYRISPGNFDVPVPNVQTRRTVRSLTMAQSPAGTASARVAKSYVDIVRARIKKAGGEEELLMRMYVPPEMRAGLRMDLNRMFGNGLDDNRNGIIDEGGSVLGARGEGDLGEPIQGFGDTNLLNDDPQEKDKNKVRDVYIRNLYALVLAVATPGDETYDWQGIQHRTFCKEVAQWCTNVCDMRDRDFIMTRFTFDLNPFDPDGWAPPQLGQPAWNSQTVFGTERPELIITEGLVGHDGRFVDNGGDDRKQMKKPQGWIYLELYNPWTDKEAFSGELYQHSRSTQLSTGVVLDQLSPPLVQGSPASAKPVWRVMFMRDDFADLDKMPTGPLETQEGKIARTMYFDDKPVTLPGDGTRNQWDYFRRTVQPIAPIRPGQFAVVGSRRIQDMGQGRQIKLTPSPDPTGSKVDIMGQQAGADPLSNLPPVAIIIDGQRKPGGGDTVQDERPFSVTEPGAQWNDYLMETQLNPANQGYYRQSGYPNRMNMPGKPNSPHTFRLGPNGETDGAYQPPFDRPLDSYRVDEGPAKFTTPGVTQGYRMASLQRLADPSKPFHLSENPFRTIDAMWCDLVVYNSESEDGALQFVSRERGVTAEQTLGHKSMLWMQEPKGGQPPGGSIAHSFGRRNKALGGQGGETGIPYPWLTFLNRPFANPMELLLVPRGSSFDLLRDYNVVRGRGGGRDIYRTPSGSWHFPHLRNFYYSEQDGTSLLGPQDWAMIFEFVGVPSPWVGAEVAGNPQNYTEIEAMRPPFFNKISSYREPGRTNLNAVSEAPPMAVLASQPDTSLSERIFSNMNSARGSTGQGNFEKPFRSFGGADLMPPDENTVNSPIDQTIFRRESKGSADPLFAFSAAGGEESTPYPRRNPYFYYQSLMRMAATTTVRSNVFAIWITVGRFEAEPTPRSESHPDGFRLGAEIGWDTGAVERHRAFYMIDRTIPVACQPGQVNNIHRAVMVSRLIE